MKKKKKKKKRRRRRRRRSESRIPSGMASFAFLSRSNSRDLRTLSYVKLGDAQNSSLCWSLETADGDFKISQVTLARYTISLTRPELFHYARRTSVKSQLFHVAAARESARRALGEINSRKFRGRRERATESPKIKGSPQTMFLNYFSRSRGHSRSDK